MRLLRSFLGTGAVVASVASCGDLSRLVRSITPVVRVAPDSATLIRGDTIILAAIVTDSQGRPIPSGVVWSSSDTTTASVDATGRVLTHRPGTVAITAATDVASAHATLHVLGPITYFQVLPPNTTVRRGHVLQMFVDARDSAGQQVHGLPVTWSSGDTTIAVVDSQGVVSARSSGRVTIRATMHGLTGGVQILVFSAVTSLTFGPDTFTTVPGARLIGFPVLRDSAHDVVQDRATYTSSAPDVAAVDSDGTITAIALGGATIVGAIDTVADTVTVRVRHVSFRGVYTSVDYYSCGLSTDSLAFCWGGGLGWGEAPGAIALATGPLALTGNARFASLDVGTGPYGCGLSGDGTTYCWGWYAAGRLGTAGITQNADTPIVITAAPKFVALSSISWHSVCGLTNTGAVYCWGAGVQTPQLISGIPAMASVFAGAAFACGLAADSTAWCWGDNQEGELGRGVIGNFNAPPDTVFGGHRWVTLGLGSGGACGIAVRDSLLCWGYHNGTDTVSLVPVPVRGDVSWSRPYGGGRDLYTHACALTTNGTAYCWGDNPYGELGTGDTTTSATPVPVAGGLLWRSLDVGLSTTCGIATSGIAYCWGLNDDAAVGDGTRTNRNVPTRVLGQP